MEELKDVVEEKIIRVKTPTRTFLMEGVVNILDYLGKQGSLRIKPTEFVCDGELTDKILEDNLNDGGFGGVTIIGGLVDVFQKVEVSESIEGENPSVKLEDTFNMVADGVSLGNSAGLKNKWLELMFN